MTVGYLFVSFFLCYRSRDCRWKVASFLLILAYLHGVLSYKNVHEYIHGPYIKYTNNLERHEGE